MKNTKIVVLHDVADWQKAEMQRAARTWKPKRSHQICKFSTHVGMIGTKDSTMPAPCWADSQRAPANWVHKEMLEKYISTSSEACSRERTEA